MSTAADTAADAGFAAVEHALDGIADAAAFGSLDLSVLGRIGVGRCPSGSTLIGWRFGLAQPVYRLRPLRPTCRRLQPLVSGLDDLRHDLPALNGVEPLHKRCQERRVRLRNKNRGIRPVPPQSPECLGVASGHGRRETLERFV